MRMILIWRGPNRFDQVLYIHTGPNRFDGPECVSFAFANLSQLENALCAYPSSSTMMIYFRAPASTSRGSMSSLFFDFAEFNAALLAYSSS